MTVVLTHLFKLLSFFILIITYDNENMIDIDRKSSGNIKLVKLIRSMKCYVIDNVINVKNSSLYAT